MAAQDQVQVILQAETLANHIKGLPGPGNQIRN